MPLDKEPNLNMWPVDPHIRVRTGAPVRSLLCGFVIWLVADQTVCIIMTGSAYTVLVCAV